MADGPEIELQRALVAHAQANTGLAALVAVRVYDEPPQGSAYPLIRLGNIDVRPVRSDCFLSWDIVFSIEGHSRPNQGRVEALRLGRALIDAFDAAALVVAGFDLHWLEFQAMAVVSDGDGRSYQANVAFEANLTATP